jgi:hypothetical protein
MHFYDIILQIIHKTIFSYRDLCRTNVLINKKEYV